MRRDFFVLGQVTQIICDDYLCSSLTMVAEDKEASSREVRVEFNEDNIGGRVDGLQGSVPTELANLRR